MFQFLERVVKSQFKFTLHTFLIDLCLSRGSGICQVSINELDRTGEEVIKGLEPVGEMGKGHA